MDVGVVKEFEGLAEILEASAVLGQHAPQFLPQDLFARSRCGLRRLRCSLKGRWSCKKKAFRVKGVLENMKT